MFYIRLKEFMEENYLKQIDLVKETGFSKSYISKICRNEKNPAKALIEYLVKKSNKSATWWLTGKDDYEDMCTLNMLLDEMINRGYIKKGMELKDIEEKYRKMIENMIKIEIDMKFKKKELLE